MRAITIYLNIFLLLYVLSTWSDAKTLTIIGDHLNVRSGPGRTYDIVEVVNKNEKYEILKEQDDWYMISVEGKLGWVSEKAVRIIADQEIPAMLKQADWYFSRLQFTTPPEANAFDIYQEVLRRDPENAHALKKLEQMTRTYKTWADTAYQKGDYEKARIFYQRYLFIVPADQTTSALLKNLQNPLAGSTASFKITHLRRDPQTLSNSDVVQMIRKNGLHHPADWAKYDLSPSITGNIQHAYEIKTLEGVNIVIDYATNLMWQQTGTPNPLTWDSAHQYIDQLNLENYAGYSDWHLPTLEELASLLEPVKKNKNLYIAPEFGTTQLWCWSADKLAASDAAWYVSFSSGGIQQHSTDNTAFVLAVRVNQ